MNIKKPLLIGAFLWPLVSLIGWTALNEYHLRVSQTLTLPIEGHDPRDLLSGHYVSYKIKYGISCPSSEYGKNPLAYMCFKPQKSITIGKKPKDCSLFIKGRCSSHGFKSKAHRFYLPEKKAKKAEKILQKALKKQVVLSISKGGQVRSKDILVEGESLKKQL